MDFSFVQPEDAVADIVINHTFIQLRAILIIQATWLLSAQICGYLPSAVGYFSITCVTTNPQRLGIIIFGYLN